MDALRAAAQQALEALDSDNPDIQLRAAIVLRSALAQEPTRQELQADGRHPAPCARHCEAQAFQIEIRRLRAPWETPR